MHRVFLLRGLMEETLVSEMEELDSAAGMPSPEPMMAEDSDASDSSQPSSQSADPLEGISGDVRPPSREASPGGDAFSGQSAAEEEIRYEDDDFEEEEEEEIDPKVFHVQCENMATIGVTALAEYIPQIASVFDRKMGDVLRITKAEADLIHSASVPAIKEMMRGSRPSPVGLLCGTLLTIYGMKFGIYFAERAMAAAEEKRKKTEASQPYVEIVSDSGMTAEAVVVEPKKKKKDKDETGGLRIVDLSAPPRGRGRPHARGKIRDVV